METIGRWCCRFRTDPPPRAACGRSDCLSGCRRRGVTCAESGPRNGIASDPRRDGVAGRRVALLKLRGQRHDLEVRQRKPEPADS